MTDREWAGLIVTAWLIGSAYWSLVCLWVAQEKERSQAAWAALGFILWFLAFLPLAVAPDLTAYEE